MALLPSLPPLASSLLFPPPSSSLPPEFSSGLRKNFQRYPEVWSPEGSFPTAGIPLAARLEESVAE
eukprot:612136-Pyramimonas_sp.AAC.1